MFVKAVQPSKADSPMVPNPSGNSIFVILVHPWKAYSPMVSIDLGNTIDFRIYMDILN